MAGCIRGVFPAEFLARLSVQQRAEFWHRELSGNRCSVLIAEENGAIVGWVSGGASRDADAQGASEVYAVYVVPDHWRHGIGRQLMTAVEACLTSHGDLTLWVLPQNRRAIDFYHTIGYEFDGVQKSEQLAGMSFSEVRLRKKRPNKAPEPTPTSVTPRADARVAPAAVVAHL